MHLLTNNTPQVFAYEPLVLREALNLVVREALHLSLSLYILFSLLLPQGYDSYYVPDQMLDRNKDGHFSLEVTLTRIPNRNI